MPTESPAIQFTYRVLLFGPEAALCGKSEALFSSASPSLPLADVKALLGQVETTLARSLRSARFAVNHAFADDSAVVRPADEIAVIGFVSGG